MMKHLPFFIFILYFFTAQGQENDPLIKNFRLDFAIPDHPAFSILDKQSDNVLRPSNTQELFSIIYSDFISGKSFLIPKNFSLEFSPALLVGINGITYDDYKSGGSRRILYDMKASIATKVNEDDSLQNIAAGLRFTWVDESSLFYNDAFIKEAYQEMHKSLSSEVKFQDSLFKSEEFRKEFGIPTGMSITDALANDATLTQKIHERFISEIEKHPEYEIFEIESVRKKYRNLNWNKMKFETAFALKFSAPDSFVSHSRYARFEVYNTFAFPIGNNNESGKPGWGQGLIAVNFSNERSDTIILQSADSNSFISDTVTSNFSSFTIASRLYAGNNAFKTFIECSYKSEIDRLRKISLNIGSEINLTDGLWAVINFGNEWINAADSKSKTASKSNWIWKIDLRFHLPEKKKI
jgi:hypothetical protein